MPEQPPKELIEKLEGLGLATAEQVARMERRVRRLSGDLPRFESVWIDALAQARLLTPFQAAELNAGRGERLRVGEYVLCERLPYPLYAEGYRARHVETSKMARLVVRVAGEPATPDALDNLAVEPWIDGKTAAEWMVQYGRFPVEAVLEIARVMAARLAELETSGICHGDICVSSLILTPEGKIDLPWPGLRGELRPEEGHSHADLPPEAFDAMAPERIASGTPPTVASDIFACGCVWWHLLCGRSPLAGGDSTAKLRAAEQCEIRDVREYAPDVPSPLAAAISACVARNPKHRPESFAQLSALLGPSTRDGRERLVAALNRSGRPAARWASAARSAGHSKNTPIWLTVAACCAALIAAVIWPIGGESKKQLPDREIAAKGHSFSGRRYVGQKTHQADVPSAAKQLDRADVPSTAKQLDVKTDGGRVVPTVYEQPAAPPMELVLSADRPTRAASIRLRDGQCVRAPTGHRAVVLTPPSGMIVDRNNVRFENIDFRREQSPSPPATLPNGEGRLAVSHSEGEAALVRLLAGEAEFHGCRFQGETEAAAVRWIHPTNRESAATALPSGRIVMADCILDGVASGVDCRTIGAVALQMTNVLHLGPGPLVQFDHYPWADESVSLAISRSTLRGAGSLIECFVADTERSPGEMSILADCCVFAPRPGNPLVRVHSVRPPRLIPVALKWNGQGSLVAPRVSVFGWFGPDSRQMVADETELTIAGLVRSEVGFAGPASSDPGMSGAVRWHAPLQTALPPGIAPEHLPSGE